MKTFLFHDDGEVRTLMKTHDTSTQIHVDGSLPLVLSIGLHIGLWRSI